MHLCAVGCGDVIGFTAVVLLSQLTSDQIDLHVAPETEFKADLFVGVS